MARPQRALLLGVLLAATACGTTVPLAQQNSVASGGGDGLGGAQPVATSDTSTTGTTGLVTGGSTSTGTTGQVASGTGSVAGGSTTGGTTGAAALPTAAGTVAASSIPTKGFGWDAKKVYIGVPTANDFESVAHAAGVAGSNGSITGDVNAIVADINRSGGIFGRQLVVEYYDVKTTDAAYNPTGTAAAVCAHFTEDRPVIAVINGSPQFDAEDSFHRCLEKKSVSLIAFSNTDFSNSDYAKLGPHLWTGGSLSTDLLVPAFVNALKRQTFFTGWDTLNGKPGNAPVKAGLLLPDTAQGHHVESVMTAALNRAGVPIASRFFYPKAGLGTKTQAEVLQFKAAGVTHILDLPPVAAEIWFFQGNAQQQHYHPRYGFTSFNLPLSVMNNSSLAPAAQQIGSMGIGWQPYNDVDAGHDPGATPGGKRCLTALSKGGQSFNSGSRRAALIGSQFCDAIYLLRDALLAGKGLSAPSILAGMPIAGPTFLAAGTFASALTSGNHGIPGFYRDQRYDAACSCFVYSGPNRPFA